MAANNRTHHAFLSLQTQGPQVPARASHAWFWTEWQAREREVDEELAAGRVTPFPDGTSFLDSLSD